MIEVTLGGDREPVRSHIEAFAQSPRPLHLLFDGFATVFTYEQSLRTSMHEFWPWALELALDVIGDGDRLRAQHHWFDYAVAALLPTPAPRSWDSDIDGTLTQCRADWLQPAALSGLEDRWLAVASGEAKAVDAVIRFARSASPVWQATVALTWIEAVIDDRQDFIANRIWHLEDWLGELRDTGLLVGDAKRRYHRVIDGLAAAGDRAAVRLQQLDE